MDASMWILLSILVFRCWSTHAQTSEGPMGSGDNETTFESSTTPVPSTNATTNHFINETTTPVPTVTTNSPQQIFCEEDTVNYPNDPTVNVTFPKTEAGFTASSIDSCPTETANSGKPYGTRQCSTHDDWLDPLWLSSCDTGLNDLLNANITSDEQRQEVATDVVTLTSDPEKLQPNEIADSAQILTQVTNTDSLTQSTSELVVVAVGNLLQVNFEDLQASNASEQLVQSLNDVVEKLNLTEGMGDFQTVSSTVAVSVLDIASNTSVESIGFEGTAEVQNRSIGFRSDQFRSFTGQPNQTAPYSIVLPPEVVNRSSRIGFFGFLNDNVFLASMSTQTGDSNDKFRLPENASVNSPVVISATIPGETIANLTSRVNITFMNLMGNESIDKNNTFCAFWNDSENFWSTRGCDTVEANNLTATCQCDHLTNFATLFATKATNDSTDYILDIITIVGSSISAFACLLTIVCILFLWRRRKLPSQVRTFALLAFLSLALLLLNVFLLVSQSKTVESSPNACQATAILIHFSLLSSLCWMMVEALYLNIAVTKPIYFKLKLSSRRVYILSALWGWGAPAVFVAVTVITKREVYEHENSCWIDPEYVIYLAIIPVAAILSFNLLSYITVLLTVVFKKNPARVSLSSDRKKNFMISVCLYVTFGLTWLFGFLTLGSHHVKIVFAYIFTVLNSLQGLFVFLLFIVRNEAMRKSLIKEVTEMSGRSSFGSQPLQPRYRKRYDVAASMDHFNKYSNSPGNKKLSQNCVTTKYDNKNYNESEITGTES